MDQTFRRMPCGDETLNSDMEARPLPETGSTELSDHFQNVQESVLAVLGIKSSGELHARPPPCIRRRN